MLCYVLPTIEGVTQEEAASVPARCHSQAAVSTSDVRCDLLQLRARRVATPHRVVSDNADAAADGLGSDCARGCLRGGGRRHSRLRGEGAGCWKRQKCEHTLATNDGPDI